MNQTIPTTGRPASQRPTKVARGYTRITERSELAKALRSIADGGHGEFGPPARPDLAQVLRRLGMATIEEGTLAYRLTDSGRACLAVVETGVATFDADDRRRD